MTDVYVRYEQHDCISDLLIINDGLDGLVISYLYFIKFDIGSVENLVFDIRRTSRHTVLISISKGILDESSVSPN